MPRSINDHLPLKPLDLEILLALADEDLHGYGLVQAVAAHTDGLISLDPGNLYRVIKRLLRLVNASSTRAVARKLAP
jgi:DNA-binding PadR family transcriptional regulator